MERELVSYYSDLLSKPKGEDPQIRWNIIQHIPRLVTSEHNSILMCPIQREEVEEAMMQMDKGTTPRSDGFTVLLSTFLGPSERRSMGNSRRFKTLKKNFKGIQCHLPHPDSQRTGGEHPREISSHISLQYDLEDHYKSARQSPQTTTTNLDIIGANWFCRRSPNPRWNYLSTWNDSLPKKNEIPGHAPKSWLGKSVW